MNFINIDSFESLQEQLQKTPEAYLLLYKSSSEASECALGNASAIKNENIIFLVTDVAVVRDIHTQYEIKTAPILLSFKNSALVNSYKGCNDVSFYEKIFGNDYFESTGNVETKKAKRVTVYSTPTCSWCTVLKKHLDQHGIKYKSIDISKDQKAAENMQKKSGKQGVPQTDINGQMIVGFDKNKINSLLEI